MAFREVPGAFERISETFQGFSGEFCGGFEAFKGFNNIMEVLDAF